MAYTLNYADSKGRFDELVESHGVKVRFRVCCCTWLCCCCCSTEGISVSMHARAACSRALNPCWITEARCGCCARAHGCCFVPVLRGRHQSQRVVHLGMEAQVRTSWLMLSLPPVWPTAPGAAEQRSTSVAHHAIAAPPTLPACLLHMLKSVSRIRCAASLFDVHRRSWWTRDR